VRLKEVKKYLVLFSGYIIGFLPMFLFEGRHGFMGMKGFVTYLFGPKDVVGFLPSQKIIISHASSFFNAFIDVFPKDIISPYILLLIVLVPAIYYFCKEKDKNLKKFISFLFLLFPVYFFVFLFFRNAIWVYYLIALNVAYILFFSYSMASVSKQKGKILKIFYLLFLIFIAIRALPTLANVFINDYKDYGGTAKIKGKIDVVDFIYNDAKGKRFGLFIFSPPIYTYPYDYILWWHAKNKFGYMPDNVKSGAFYLLIEKDGGQPWRHKGWMETVIKDGNIIWEKELTNGFIVQKRIAE